MHTATTKYGFTLIELMIALVIVSVLASFAYPTYMLSVRKSRRADAEGVLVQAAYFMERYYSTNNAYTGATLPTLALDRAPANSSDGSRYYIISLSNLTATTYTLTATPQTYGNQTGDTCGNLTLNQAGTKGQQNGTTEDCWR